MRKVKIKAPRGISATLEEKFRHRYEVEVEVIPDHPKAICQIMVGKNRKWITICSFAADENIKDIITMFEVNFQLRKWTPITEPFGFRIFISIHLEYLNQKNESYWGFEDREFSIGIRTYLR